MINNRVCPPSSSSFFFFFCSVHDGGIGYDGVDHSVYDGGSGYDGVGVCVYDGGSGYDGVGGCGSFFFFYFNFHMFTKVQFILSNAVI